MSSSPCSTPLPTATGSWVKTVSPASSTAASLIELKKSRWISGVATTQARVPRMLPASITAMMDCHIRGWCLRGPARK